MELLANPAKHGMSQEQAQAVSAKLAPAGEEMGQGNKKVDLASKWLQDLHQRKARKEKQLEKTLADQAEARRMKNKAARERRSAAVAAKAGKAAEEAAANEAATAPVPEPQPEPVSAPAPKQKKKK